MLAALCLGRSGTCTLDGHRARALGCGFAACWDAGAPGTPMTVGDKPRENAFGYKTPFRPSFSERAPRLCERRHPPMQLGSSR